MIDPVLICVAAYVLLFAFIVLLRWDAGRHK